MFSFRNKEELTGFIANEVINTSEAKKILDCSRQYVDKLVLQGKLVPIKKLEKDKWFYKEDVLKLKSKKNTESENDKFYKKIIIEKK